MTRIASEHQSVLASLSEGAVSRSEIGVGAKCRRVVTDLVDAGMVRREWDYGIHGYYVTGYSLTEDGRALLLEVTSALQPGVPAGSIEEPAGDELQAEALRLLGGAA